MQHRISQLDREFQLAFERGQVPLADFDHRAHLRLAYVYSVNATTVEAHQKMRAALFGYLQHNQIDVAKYHETMTRAWLMAVRHFIENTHASISADDFIAQHPQLLDTEIMLSHYSADLLFSAAARAEFVEPDKEPIPEYPVTE